MVVVCDSDCNCHYRVHQSAPIHKTVIVQSCQHLLIHRARFIYCNYSDKTLSSPLSCTEYLLDSLFISALWPFYSRRLPFLIIFLNSYEFTCSPDLLYGGLNQNKKPLMIVWNLFLFRQVTSVNASFKHILQVTVHSTKKKVRNVMTKKKNFLDVVTFIMEGGLHKHRWNLMDGTMSDLQMYHEALHVALHL